MSEAGAPAPARAASGFWRFFAETVLATASAGVVGVAPTLVLAGRGALPSLVAGCGIGLLAGLLGAVPIAVLAAASPVLRAQAVLIAMAVRLPAALLLGALAAVSGRFERAPLLVWVAIGYAVQLIVESRYAIRTLGGDGLRAKPGRATVAGRPEQRRP